MYRRQVFIITVIVIKHSYIYLKIILKIKIYIDTSSFNHLIKLFQYRIWYKYTKFNINMYIYYYTF